MKTQMEIARYMELQQIIVQVCHLKMVSFVSKNKLLLHSQNTFSVLFKIDQQVNDSAGNMQNVRDTDQSFTDSNNSVYGTPLDMPDNVADCKIIWLL